MSLILKGIDLPEEYYYTSILILKDGSIFKQDENDGRYYQIGHEAIQIPKGHGDIVDKDELIIRRDIIGRVGIMGSYEAITGYYEAINNDVNVLLKSEEE